MITAKQKTLIYIITIFTVAAFFRFYDLEKRGLFEWDEGYYVELVKTHRAGFDYLIKTRILGQNPGDLGVYIYENGGAFESVSKDGFTYFSALASVIFGMSENTILFTNALIGALTALLIFIFLKERIFLDTAFLIGLAFSVSPYHIGYSRGGYSTIIGAFFLLISVYSYNRYLQTDKQPLLLYSGLALGISFSCHYVIGYFVFVIFGYEFYRFLIKKATFKKLGTLVFVFSVPLLAVESVSRIIRSFSSRISSQAPIVINFFTFFEKFPRQILSADGAEAVKKFSQSYYLENLILHEGFIIFILFFMLLGLIYQRKERLSNIFLVILISLPFVLLSLKYRGAGRVIPLFLPLIYFIIGWCMLYLKSWVRGVVIILIAISVFHNAYKSLDYFNYRSNFDQALDYMYSHGSVKHLSDDMYVSRAYVGRKNVLDDFVSIAKEKNDDRYVSLQKIEELYYQGYKYLLLYDIPYHLNELTETALTMEPDFSTESIGNNRGVPYIDLGLLRAKDSRPCRHIYVYSLDRVINKLESIIQD
ncbi:ArnT family glycosyltransferase [Candidatus Omnitrophota bacterium]